MSTQPRVLIVYYSHTKQAQRVCDAMTATLQERGCDVSQANIEFTDPHYAKNFSVFPFRHAVFGILPLLLPQLRRKTGEIRIPDEAKQGDYDLVVLGSPTWFFTANMPMRSYLKSDEARAVLEGKPFGVYVVCRRYWSINFKEVKSSPWSKAESTLTRFISSTRVGRSGRCWRCSATSARARCGRGPSASRSLRPTYSRGMKIRLPRSRKDWRTTGRARLPAA